MTQGPEPGLDREKALKPFMVQLFSAMSLLHGRYIAHCDISMENILVSKNPTDGHLQVGNCLNSFRRSLFMRAKIWGTPHEL